MSRWYSKTKGEIPKKIYIQQSKGNSLFGPYFSKVACPNGFEQIEYTLCEDTGNFIRVTPFVKDIKGAKKKLDI